MSKNILLIGEKSPWAETLISALSNVAEIETTPDVFPVEKVRKKKYDLIVIDAAFLKEIANVIKSIHQEIPEIRIVVVTSSKTWQRSRQVFLAGATDYLQKSADRKSLFETFTKILSE